MTSMFPPWSIAPDATQVLSPFVQLYHAALKNQAVSVVRHPLSIAGFLMGKFVAQVDSFGGKDFLKKLYTVRVSARSAHSGDCRGTVRTPLDSMNSSNSRRNLINVEFSLGMHVAHGRVTYDEVRNAYD
eukprot:PhM_4_TR9132/c0_g2_i5/m.34700